MMNVQNLPVVSSEHIEYAGHVGHTEGTLDVFPRAWELAEKIARTDFVPEALRGKPEGVLAAILTGREVGLSEMQSLAQINVIKGRPAISAQALRGLVLSQGHEIAYEEQTTTRCVVAGRRHGSDRWTMVTWTMDDAKRAHLAGKDNWRQYPRAMLVARATTELCRLIFADVIAGIGYTVEELTDGDVIDIADVNAVAAVETTIPKKRTAKRPARKEPASAVRPSQPPLDPEVIDVPEPPLPGDEPESHPANDASKRAQKLAIACREAGIADHHHLVQAVTFGEASSAKELSPEGYAEAREAARAVGAGKMRLVEDPDAGFRLQETEALEAEIAEEDGWGEVDWRSFLKTREVRVPAFMRQAVALCDERGISPPGTIAAVAALDAPEVHSLLRGWVEDQAAGDG